MKSLLTIQILIKNNEKTIEKTLNSICDLNSSIHIINLGCNDNTLNICKKYNCYIDNVKTNDLSKTRNEFIKSYKTDWILYLEPWESIYLGKENIINNLNEAECFKFSVLKEDVISKQVRLFNKNINCYFENPAFETIQCKSTKELDCYILSDVPNYSHYEEIIKKWKDDKPLSKLPIYYSSYMHLLKNNYNDFINESNIFLYLNNDLNKSFYMIKYYQSMVYCYITKKYELAIKNIMECIISNPTMAEFWCLLGDIYYQILDYEKAIIFYSNAIDLGINRSTLNDWPLEVSKYKEYPEKMINSCKNILKSIKLYI